MMIEKSWNVTVILIRIASIISKDIMIVYIEYIIRGVLGTRFFLGVINVNVLLLFDWMNLKYLKPYCTYIGQPLLYHKR